MCVQKVRGATVKATQSHASWCGLPWTLSREIQHKRVVNTKYFIDLPYQTKKESVLDLAKLKIQRKTNFSVEF